MRAPVGYVGVGGGRLAEEDEEVERQEEERRKCDVIWRRHHLVRTCTYATRCLRAQSSCQGTSTVEASNSCSKVRRL